MKPLYIFDLDGTIALTEHRQALVYSGDCGICGGKGLVLEGGQEKGFHPLIECPMCEGSGQLKENWKKFFAECVNDQPNLPVIETLQNLVDAGADVWIWSGRSSEVMEQTKAWLQNNLAQDAEDLSLCMRVEGDFTPDEQLKQGWLEQLSAYDRRRLVAVFDDRDKVVAMWRANGVPCFQIAPGAF